MRNGKSQSKNRPQEAKPIGPQGWTDNAIKPNLISVKAQQNRKGSVGIISPNTNSLVQNKLIFSGSQLTTAIAMVEQHTATKEFGFEMNEP